MPAFALISWPILALVFFAALGPARGLIWSVVVGYLFLPEGYGFDLPLLPRYGKTAAIALASVLGLFVFRKRIETDDIVVADKRFQKVMYGLLAILLIAPFGTGLTNREFLVTGPLVRPALSPPDILNMVTDSLILFLPLLLGWRFLNREEHHRELLIAVVASGLFYSLLILFELRMSPQLNNWVYGYFPHSWQQHLRGGGFRPIVFLDHGLSVGFFLFSVVLAAFALSRDKALMRSLFFLAGGWSFLVLLISYNLGASMIAVVLIPVVLLLPVRGQLLAATVVAAIFVGYPVLKQSGLSPDRLVVTISESISKQRASSLTFRLRNEELFLGRALEKPVFGWGGWSRGRVFDEFGRDMTTADGTWVLILGQRGWVGYIAFFGLIIVPMLFLWRTHRRKTISPAVMGMVAITTGNLLYLIPNSSLSPIGLLMMGSIAAFAQYDRVRNEAPATGSESQGVSRQTRYTRFPAKERDGRLGPSALRRPG